MSLIQIQIHVLDFSYYMFFFVFCVLANVLSLFACVEILKLQMACSFFIVLFPEDCYVSVSACVCEHFCSFSFCSVVFQSFFYAQFSAIFVQFQFFEFIFVQFQFVQLSVSFSVILLCLVFSFLYLHFLVLVLSRLQVLNKPKKWWL